MFTTYEPNHFPGADFLKYLNIFGRPARQVLNAVMKRFIHQWFEPYREFRKEIGLNPDHDPVVTDKYSRYLHLAMFSKAWENLSRIGTQERFKPVSVSTMETKIWA